MSRTHLLRLICRCSYLWCEVFSMSLHNESFLFLGIMDVFCIGNPFFFVKLGHLWPFRAFPHSIMHKIYEDACIWTYCWRLWYCKSGKLTAMEVFKRFIVVVQVVFEVHYLCKLIQQYFKRQLVINVERRWFGMFGSLDYVHYCGNFSL